MQENGLDQLRNQRIKMLTKEQENKVRLAWNEMYPMRQDNEEQWEEWKTVDCPSRDQRYAFTRGFSKSKGWNL